MCRPGLRKEREIVYNLDIADCKKTKNIRKCPEIAGGIAGNF
jgi:hypothetical protein